jgi:hypothetical protein
VRERVAPEITIDNLQYQTPIAMALVNSQQPRRVYRFRSCDGECRSTTESIILPAFWGMPIAQFLRKKFEVESERGVGQ